MQMIAPSRLSHELRNETSPDLSRRRWGIGLSLIGVAIGGIVAAYQTGIIKRLPDILPGPIWDAEKVDASDYAYKRLQTPDAAMMVVTYGLTAGLIAAGGKERAKQAPALPIAAAVKALFDFVTCVQLGREEWAENKALCSYCQVATAASAATLALTLPEAVRASKALA
jgi:uncharacterized membrane protein